MAQNLPVVEHVVLSAETFLQQLPTTILWLDDGLGILERIRHEANVVEEPVHPEATQIIGQMAGRQLVKRHTHTRITIQALDTYLIDSRLAI